MALNLTQPSWNYSPDNNNILLKIKIIRRRSGVAWGWADQLPGETRLEAFGEVAHLEMLRNKTKGKGSEGRKENEKET